MENLITAFLTYEVVGITLEDYWWAVIIFIAFFTLLKFFEKVIVLRLRVLAKKTETELDDLFVEIIDDVGWPLYAVISLLLAIQIISVPDMIMTACCRVVVIIATFYAVKAIQKIVGYGAKQIVKKQMEEDPNSDTAIIMLMSRVLKVLLWVIAVVLILANLGYDVTTLIAGLGIGGIAIAFALQSVLQDIFASISIYFDKPFKAGDFIVIGSDKGTVKDIGIKSTRIQTLDGPELVVSNKELTETRVMNYKKMERRRGTFVFGVTYDTPLEKLEKIPAIVENILHKHEMADLDRVHFTELADFSLNHEVVFYMKNSDFKTYRDTQQILNLELMRAFEKEKIEFAFPSQTIYVQKA